MKKLLILVLVLGLASVASASLTGLTADLAGDNTAGAGSITVTVTPTGATSQIATYLVITYQGSVSLTTALGVKAPGDSGFVCLMSDVGLDGTYGEGDLWVMASATPLYETGVWIDGSYTGAVAGDVFNLYESDGENFDLLDSITIIPEPATIALLCLGGLLIRKK